MYARYPGYSYHLVDGWVVPDVGAAHLEGIIDHINPGPG